MKQSREGRMAQQIRVDCEYVTARKDQTAICIVDGTEEVNALGKKTPKKTWIDVDRITDSSYEYLTDLAMGDKIEIFIPEWYALQKGLI